jgi:hypothetical protein
MATMWNEALGGINGYVSGLREAKITLAVFDTNSYDVIRNTTSENWVNVTNEEVQPRGGTPLLDSAGRILWSAIDSKAERAVIVIVTDGEENSSKKFTAKEVKELTNKVDKDLDYEVVFLGANFDKIGQVAETNFGINTKDDYWASRTLSTSTRGFAQAMNSTLGSTQNYFAEGKAAAFYSDDDKVKAKV